MTASPTSVCNQALARLGAQLILSLEDGSTEALYCTEMYPVARDQVLELGVWNFATHRAILGQSAEAPVWGWAYQYPLPTDPWCLRVRAVDPDTALWGVELDQQGRRVLMTDETSISIVYTARVEDLTLWSPLALETLAVLLASKLAKPLTGQTSLRESLLKEAMGMLGEARTSDGRERTVRRLSLPSSIVAARHGRPGSYLDS